MDNNRNHNYVGKCARVVFLFLKDIIIISCLNKNNYNIKYSKVHNHSTKTDRFITQSTIHDCSTKPKSREKEVYYWTILVHE